MTLAKVLGLLMVLMFSREAPQLVKSDAPKLKERRAEIHKLAALHAEVTKKGALIDPKTDAALFAAISWYESRQMLKPRDGDRRLMRDGKIRGTAVGPMQVSMGATEWVKWWDVGKKKYKGLTVKQMRDPKFNIELFYDIMQHWKKTCGGPPGVWITAYGWGRCPKYDYTRKHKTVDWEGRRRCKLMTATMKRMAANPDFDYEMPEDWYCGHEKYPRDARVAKAEKKGNQG